MAVFLISCMINLKELYPEFPELKALPRLVRTTIAPIQLATARLVDKALKEVEKERCYQRIAFV